MKQTSRIKQNATIEMTNLNALKEPSSNYNTNSIDIVDSEYSSTSQTKVINESRSKCCSRLKSSLCKLVPHFMKTLIFLIVCLVICNILLIGITAYGLTMGLMSTKSLIQPHNLVNTTTT